MHVLEPSHVPALTLADSLGTGDAGDDRQVRVPVLGIQGLRVPLPDLDPGNLPPPLPPPPPYRHSYSFFSTFLQVAQHGIRPTLPEKTPPSLKELLRRCWAQNPEDRYHLASLCLRASIVTHLYLLTDLHLYLCVTCITSLLPLAALLPLFHRSQAGRQRSTATTAKDRRSVQSQPQRVGRPLFLGLSANSREAQRARRPDRS